MTAYTASPFLTAPDLSDDVVAVGKIDAVSMILEMVKQVTGMRFAAVARVTDCRWVACAVDDSIDFGLIPGAELALESTICHEIRQHRKPVIFGHANKHPIFSEHHTPRIYQLESYVSVPIICADGEFFGTLCAIDTVPAQLDEPNVLKTLDLYARLISTNLALQGGLDRSEHALADALAIGKLRDQFIAVLGHDLRTPLSEVRMGAEILASRLTNARDLAVAEGIRKSALRMGTLIEDVLDFARGQLGTGIPIKSVRVDDLGEQLEEVIHEVRALHPDTPISGFMALPPGVHCDPVRLGQLLSNLLNNAATHGASDQPVTVSARLVDRNLILTVDNQGPPIAPDQLPLLFQPFKRSEAGLRQQGLGLGLYIAHEICTGHGGTLEVVSTEEVGTRFVATIPQIGEG